MIWVNINTHNDEINSLEIIGHAEFLESGQDVVCAACSLTATGLLNALDQLVPETCDLIKEENRIYIEVRSNNNEVQTIINTGIIQLETLAETFNKYIKIKKTEVKL